MYNDNIKEDGRFKESISFYSKGKAYSGIEEGAHIKAEYTIQSDIVAEDGTRTITLKLVDKAEHEAKVDKLSKLLAEKLGEPKSKLLIKLFKDTLIDYYTSVVDRLIQKIEKGEPVKAREGCFDIIIGDGRRRRSERIVLNK